MVRYPSIFRLTTVKCFSCSKVVPLSPTTHSPSFYKSTTRPHSLISTRSQNVVPCPAQSTKSRSKSNPSRSKQTSAIPKLKPFILNYRSTCPTIPPIINVSFISKETTVKLANKANTCPSSALIQKSKHLSKSSLLATKVKFVL